MQLLRASFENQMDAAKAVAALDARFDAETKDAKVVVGHGVGYVSFLSWGQKDCRRH